MHTTLPKNGPLSGMLLTGLAAAITLPLAIFSPGFRSHFETPLSRELLGVFFVSAVLMALHKLESFWFEEYEQCPVYVTSGETPWAHNPRKAVFLGFVPTFIGMLFVTCLAFLGPPWHLIVLTVWLGQGAHELHHVAKSLSRGRLYPGSVTSILFVGVMWLGLFPLWHDAVFAARGLAFYGTYAALPLVVLAFFLEDRKWIAQAPRSIWSPPTHALRSAS